MPFSLLSLTQNPNVKIYFLVKEIFFNGVTPSDLPIAGEFDSKLTSHTSNKQTVACWIVIVQRQRGANSY